MKRNYVVTESETITKSIFSKEDEKMVEHLLRKMLGIPENVELDDNLKDTPHRWCKMWTEMTEGYRTNPADYLNKMFPVNSENMADDAEKRHFDGNATKPMYEQGIVVCPPMRGPTAATIWLRCIVAWMWPTFRRTMWLDFPRLSVW